MTRAGRGVQRSKVDTARVVVVPSEYQGVIGGHLSTRMQIILEAVWRGGYQRADRLEVAWCRPTNAPCPEPVRAWLGARAGDPSFKPREYPSDDFYPLVGAEVAVARREADLTIVFSHSADLLRSIAQRERRLSPVVLVGLEPGSYDVRQLGGDFRRVVRRAPWHFKYPPSTVSEVCWWQP